MGTSKVADQVEYYVTLDERITLQLHDDGSVHLNTTVQRRGEKGQPVTAEEREFNVAVDAVESLLMALMAAGVINRSNTDATERAIRSTTDHIGNKYGE